MSSSTLQQTPNLNDRRVRLLEARLSGSGNGGGSSNASAESPSLNHTNSSTTYVPMMELHSAMKPQFLLQNPLGDQQATSLEPHVILPILPVAPITDPVGRDDSNVSVRSASSEQNSGEQLNEVPSETRNLSASSNSVSQMSVEPTIIQGDGRKRKRGKINPDSNTSPLSKPTKNIRVEIGQQGSSAISNGTVTASSGRRASDLHSKSSMTGSPSPSSSASLPRSGSVATIPVPPAPGSRSPLHPATGLYASVVPPQASVQLLPSSNPVINNSNLGSNSAYPKSFSSTTTASQTDLGMKDMTSLITKQSSEKADKEKTVQTFEQRIAEMSKEIVKLKHKLDTSDGRLLKCVEMEKKLLSEKSSMEKKSARSKSVHNRMKLGQFVTQREGANFEEKFLDGYAFNELHKRMDELTAEKEELDRRRKLLLKRKPTDKTSRKNASSTAVVATSGVQSNDIDIVASAAPVGTVSQPFASALVGVTNSTANGPAAANWSTDFIQPEVREWTWSDYAQEDEILKLRTAQLKKDEQDCATELEKMERERLIHIRELKRIFNEDQSVFKSNPVLNNRYLLLTLIGKGGFSEVHKAFDIEEQRYVAVKVHQLIKEWKDEKKANYIKHALREYHVHKHLTHPRVVKLYDVFEIDSNSFATVLEYVEGNDLDFYLKQQKTIPEREARIMISQVVSALKYFNELKPPIIHYDLKPGNILLGHGSSSGEIKVTDFGLSKVCDDEHYDSDFGMDLTSQGAGTYWYLPPEVFETSNTPKISSKVDVWSVGVIFYQMLYGRKPYGDKQSQREVLQNFTILNAREVEFPAKPQISLEAKNFIRRCLTLRKDDRPEVRQLVHDDYLQLTTKLTKGNPSVAPTATFSNAGPSNHYAMDDLNELTEAPLAERELDCEELEEEEWQDFSSTQIPSSSAGCAESTFGSSGYSSLAGTSENLRSVTGKSGKMEQHFSEGMSRSGSLEDLVGSFDEKISQCFGDMESDVSDFAPVQIRTHDELISQSKFWQDLTSSFGTVMPVDWSKTIIRNKLFLPVLALNCQPNAAVNVPAATATSVERNSLGEASSSDEELNNQLDMHNMVSTNSEHGGLASADDVIKEIDAIMQQADGSDASRLEQSDGRSETEGSSSLPSLPSPLFEEKLHDLNASELLELQAELERLTQKYSEILIQELALRDEQQFEKEVKNSFISELIKVQNKRRQLAIDKKRNSHLKAKTPDREAKYLTTIIPYEPGHLTTRHMQIMIKILAAINEDSPTTPTLLTDYILKVLCPKEDLL